MDSEIRGLGDTNGVAADIGLSLMQIGMVTGLHAAISPSVFTFACFARKPEECAIARKTLWISISATTLVNIGTLIVFKRWIPAIIGQAVAAGLFGLGMGAVSSNETAPLQPTMAPQAPVQKSEVRGIGRIYGQPDILRVDDPSWHHYLDVRARQRAAG